MYNGNTLTVKHIYIYYKYASLLIIEHPNTLFESKMYILSMLYACCSLIFHANILGPLLIIFRKSFENPKTHRYSWLHKINNAFSQNRVPGHWEKHFSDISLIFPWQNNFSGRTYFHFNFHSRHKWVKFLR